MNLSVLLRYKYIIITVTDVIYNTVLEIVLVRILKNALMVTKIDWTSFNVNCLMYNCLMLLPDMLAHINQCIVVITGHLIILQ